MEGVDVDVLLHTQPLQRECTCAADKRECGTEREAAAEEERETAGQRNVRSVFALELHPVRVEDPERDDQRSERECREEARE